MTGRDASSVSSFALLDDSTANHESPTSRLYGGFVREHRCDDPATLDAVCAAADADLAAGLHALLLADYEWGARLLRAGHQGIATHDAGALRLLMFERCERLSRDAVDRWLAAQDRAGEPSPAGFMNLRPSIDRAQFDTAIERIHALIRDGETYQVNFTYRIEAEAFGSAAALYRRLRARQPVAFGAWVALPEGGAVISCSPELFVRHENGRITARPMKGTARREPVAEGDSETARWLGADAKNRAENLMIVDLLRNDLGRIATTGSVRVPTLFALEPYRTVLQMTSTVEAELPPATTFADMLRALFPCGSVTGAPKHHTMQLIAQLESTPRGLYTGAIGWLDAPQAPRRCGDFCLSVAIRTVTVGHEALGRRPAKLGIGAGIVLDSRADDEFEECHLKARFLTTLDPGFELFETLFATQERGVRHLDRHLARLAHSAQVLGFAFDRERALAELAASLGKLALSITPRLRLRLRLALAHDGRVAVSCAPLEPLPDGRVNVLLDPRPLPEGRPLSAHKTTLRAHYDEGIRQAERRGAFDSLFFTADGRVVEGGRSNVFVLVDGRWWTPPLTDGALPGVMRGLLLEDPAWQAGERTLRRAHLQRARSVIVCNALRGAMPARLMQDA